MGLVGIGFLYQRGEVVRYPVPAMVLPRKANPSPKCPFAQLITVIVESIAVNGKDELIDVFDSFLFHSDLVV